MEITIIAHASVLVRMGSHRILVDPVFDDVFASGTLCFDPPRRIDTEALVAQTTLLAVTHIHLDHFHPDTLQRFPRTLPVLVPPHPPLVQALRSMGFQDLVELAPWQAHDTGEGRITATPSDFELAEFGLVFERGEDRYWHMSDAIVDRADGQRLRQTLGPMSVTAARYQPVRTLIAYQRGLQATRLDRDELTAGLEAACESAPALVFPYFSGFAFHGPHAWANRHVGPFSATEIARWLRRRLDPAARVATVSPGDRLVVHGRQVSILRDQGGFVRPGSGPPAHDWEPIDATTLAGPSTPAQRAWLAVELHQLLQREVLPWITGHRGCGSGLFDLYHRYQCIWQGVIHLGAGQRLYHAIDFRPASPRLHGALRHPEANVFSHIGGRDLLSVLQRRAGAEVFWMAGGYRMYEKILLLEDGRLREPPLRDWDLFEQLPDPVVHYLRRMGRRRGGTPA